jgi:Rod binding domain-containing protein
VGTVSGSSSSLTLSSAGASAASALPPLGTPALGKGAKAAREFEAQLIGSVLESLEKTFAAIPGEDTMAGADNYNYMGTQALASVMAAGGGFGIAKLISEHFGGTKVSPVGTAPSGLKPASGH